MKTFLVLFLLFLGIHFTGWARTNDLRILIGGNAYVTAYQDGAKITDNGILNWTDPNSVISVFFMPVKPALSIYLYSEKGIPV